MDTEDLQLSRRKRKASKRITRRSFPEREDTVREKRPKGVWGVASIVLQRRRKEQEEDAYI